MSARKYAVGAVVGAVAGMIAGLLTAPKSEKDARTAIKDTAEQLKEIRKNEDQPKEG